jgi:hypothetical protein
MNLTHSAYTTSGDEEIVDTGEKPWVVTGWSNDNDADTPLIQLTDEGSVDTRSETVAFLDQWAREFIENRSCSDP